MYCNVYSYIYIHIYIYIYIYILALFLVCCKKVINIHIYIYIYAYSVTVGIVLHAVYRKEEGMVSYYRLDRISCWIVIPLMLAIVRYIIVHVVYGAVCIVLLIVCMYIAYCFIL